MGIDMDEMEVRVNPKNLLDDWKGNEMVPSQKNRKLFGTQNLLKSVANPLEGFLFISQRQFQVSHIMDRDFIQVSLEIRAIGFDAPGGPPDR
jgi:hypothetical protein